MLRRLIVILVLLSYLFANTGILVHLHYCGDDLARWELYQTTDDCCGGDRSCNGKAAVSTSCCKDKLVTNRMSADQTLSQGHPFHLSDAADPDFLGPVLWVPSWEISVLPARMLSAHRPKAPPGRWQNIPLHKLYHQFIYYS